MPDWTQHTFTIFYSREDEMYVATSNQETYVSALATTPDGALTELLSVLNRIAQST